MRAVCQRVSEARVTVEDIVVGEIGSGLLVLLGVARGDSPADADRLAAKVARLRIFAGHDEKFDRSLVDFGGAALVVSQFTLIADTKPRKEAQGQFVPGWKGNRPSFTQAARPEQAEPLYERFCAALAAENVPVERGVFGARMSVHSVNEGPVTLIIDG